MRSPSPQATPPADPLPVEEIPPDHPFFGTEVDGLLASDRSWMEHEFLASYTEATRRTVKQKFDRFAAFCTSIGAASMPARRSTVYRYIRFLREEGRIGVRSVPQYLAAVSMVHHMAGHLSFSAFDGVTRVLVRAWRRQDPSPVQHHPPVPSDVILRLLDLGLHSEDLAHVRAACSAVLDFIFMNRAQSGHRVFIDDYRVEDGVLIFRERCTKLRPGEAPQLRYRSWPTTGVPEVIDLLFRWSALRDHAWARAGASSDHFWRLPGERSPGPKAVSAWFSEVLAAEPGLARTPFTHHGLRGGGATACFALEVAERRIRAWGGWKSAALWSYIDLTRLPSEFDFRLFGWLTITARDLHEAYGHIFCSGGA